MADIHDRVSRSRAVVAHEGWPWLLATIVIGVVAARLQFFPVTVAMGVATVLLFLLFRDPQRVVPPLPAAIYAPVDGRVLAVDQVPGPNLQAGWWRIRIRASRLGAYTVRAPIEGTIHDIPAGSVEGQRLAGLRLISEEGDEILLAFPVQGWLRSPKAFVRYGERLGQGERFAYLRLAPVAEVYLPAVCRVNVAQASLIRAGDTVLAELLSG